MEDSLITTLGALGYSVFRQGSITDGDYPDSFFTFWNHASPDHSHYDNDNYGTAWSFAVYFYSVDPSLTYSVLDSARTSLKSAGWVVPSRGFDVYSDVPTHTGRGLEISYLET